MFSPNCDPRRSLATPAVAIGLRPWPEPKAAFSGWALAKNALYQRDVSFATLEEYDVAAGKVVGRKVVGAAVHYGYTIDGINTYGPGAKVSVLFGSEERIVGYIDTLRSHKAARPVKLIDPQKAVARYIEYGRPRTLLRSGGGIVEQVLVDQVELVYYLKAASKKQEEIRPHYLIKGRFVCQDPKGREIKHRRL